MIEDDYPDLDYEELAKACVYALQQFVTADYKEAEGAPCSAEEHRSMGYRRLREAMKIEKSVKEGT